MRRVRRRNEACRRNQGCFLPACRPRNGNFASANEACHEADRLVSRLGCPREVLSKTQHMIGLTSCGVPKIDITERFLGSTTLLSNGRRQGITTTSTTYEHDVWKKSPKCVPVSSFYPRQFLQELSVRPDPLLHRTGPFAGHRSACE